MTEDTAEGEVGTSSDPSHPHRHPLAGLHCGFQRAHSAAVEKGRRGRTYPPSSGSSQQEPTLRSQREMFLFERRKLRQVPDGPRTGQATLGKVADLRWPSPRYSRVGLGGSR